MTLEKMEELQNIIEDYINLAQSRHFVVEEDLSSYMEKMRDHWATLVEYIDKELQKAREERKGWKGYVVVDPKADNYKYSPIYMDRREATLWLAENGDDDLEVAEVDILLAHQSELDQHAV